MQFYLTLISVLLKKFSGEEGERVDVQKLFGYIGLFTLVALWWLGKSTFRALKIRGYMCGISYCKEKNVIMGF